RLFPRHLAPGIRDLLADHRIEDAVLVVCVAIREAALHAGMAAIGLAVLVGNHAHHLVALHFRLEGAADAAIGAGGDRRPFRHAHFNDGFLAQRARWAGLYAGAAGHAFRFEEGFAHAGGNAAFEAAPLDSQRKGALHLLAGAYA